LRSSTRSSVQVPPASIIFKLASIVAGLSPESQMPRGQGFVSDRVAKVAPEGESRCTNAVLD
jgi:hypothetical protein